MSSTRYNKTGEFSPEAKLASSAIRGINIGLNIVCRVARAHDEATARCMIWLTNYAVYRKITADALSTDLDMDKAAIRGALTDPEFEDMPLFRQKVTALRKRFEESLPTIAETEVVQTVRRACKFAHRNSKVVEVVGKTRLGKTVGGRDFYLRHLDECVWFECPANDSEYAFLFDLGREVGISTGGGKKGGVIRCQIKEVFALGFIKILFIDEGHRLWPADIRVKPRRIEFIRETNQDGRGPSVIIFATPQHTESLNESIEKAGRWAPGQYEGRVVRFHLEDSMSDADLSAVARYHGPDLSNEMVEQLVNLAKASEGYCGIMVNTIDLARDEADGGSITVKILKDCMRQMMQSTQVGKVIKMRKAA